LTTVLILVSFSDFNACIEHLFEFFGGADLRFLLLEITIDQRVLIMMIEAGNVCVFQFLI